MTTRLYLAGPDVFHPQAVAIGVAKKALCGRHGLTGLFPLDGGTPDMTSGAIYAACLAMMREADGGIFNLTPFRGPSADVGTVFELGVMAAMGKPVLAYTNDARDLLDRLHDLPGLSRLGEGWRDADGMAAEDFGLVDNLMLDQTLALQGRRIHRRDVAAAERFTDLVGFEACVAEASAWAGREASAEAAAPGESGTTGSRLAVILQD